MQVTGTAAGPWRRRLILALEVVIAVYALALLLYAVGIGDLGIASINRGEKPLLILLVAVPLRVTLGGSWWLLELLRRRLPEPSRLRALTIDRVPPAVADAVFAIAVVRLGSVFVGFAANVMFPPSRLRTLVLPFRQAKFLEIFAAWDSGWYFDIARRGYYWSADGQSSIAFFPLYPMLIRAFQEVTGLGDAVSALAVSDRKSVV